MLSRLFQMVYILIEKPNTTAKQLAEHLEVSKRTIYRDIDKLSAAGIPIYAQKGKGGGIALLSDYVLDKTALSETERAEILSSLQALGESGYEDEKRALSKLKDFFGADTTDWIEIDFTGWGDRTEEEKRFRIVKNAILNHQYLEIEYAGMKESVHRKIRPLKLLFRAQAWYVYAYCELRMDYRYFKLRRIVNSELLEEYFEAETVGRLCKNEYQENERQKATQIITLKISKEMAFRAYDELDGITTLENGDLLCQIEVTDLEWFWSYVFSYGEFAELIAPESARQEMKYKIEKMEKLYRVYTEQA